MPNKAIIVTTINAPNEAIRDIAHEAPEWDFIVIGDTKTPSPWEFPGVRYYDVPAQQSLDFRLAKLCPTRHYARKNLGYLLAIQGGAPVIAETDDDNLPYPGVAWQPHKNYLGAASEEARLGKRLRALLTGTNLAARVSP